MGVTFLEAYSSPTHADLSTDAALREGEGEGHAPTMLDLFPALAGVRKGAQHPTEESEESSPVDRAS